MPPKNPVVIFTSMYNKVCHATSMGKFLPKGAKEPHYGLSCLADQRLLDSAMQFSILCNVWCGAVLKLYIVEIAQKIAVQFYHKCNLTFVHFNAIEQSHSENGVAFRKPHTKIDWP